MQWRYNIFQIFPIITTTVAEEMKVLSRRSCNDLARLENHHDIDPVTLGILKEHWLLGTVMKMNVLMIILLLISSEYWQLVRTKTITVDFSTNTNPKPGKSVRRRWSGKMLQILSWQSLGANGTTFCISLGVDIKPGQDRPLLLILPVWLRCLLVGASSQLAGLLDCGMIMISS